MTSPYGTVEQAIVSGDPAQLRKMLKQTPTMATQFIHEDLQAIHLAAKHGKVDAIRILLEHGADVNAKDSVGITPLHYAARQGHFDAASFLINAGANIEAADNSGERPLHRAVRADNSQLVLELVANGADINARDRFHRTPLHYAAYEPYPEAAEALIALGADLECRNEEDHTPLHLSLGQLPPDSCTVLGLLLRGGAYLDIYTAVALGMTHIVRAMLNDNPKLLNTEPNVKDLITAAVRAKNMELVEMLVACGLDVNECRHDPPALWETLGMGNEFYMPTAKLLLDLGADPSLKWWQGMSPLEWAEKFDGELLRLFVERKPTWGKKKANQKRKRK